MTADSERRRVRAGGTIVLSSVVSRGWVTLRPEILTNRKHTTGARLRRPRSASAIEYNLGAWQAAVHEVEATYRSGEPHYPDLPCCDAVRRGVVARDKLEAVVRRGGRPGRRVSQALATLDDRFLAATEENKDAPPWLAWWHRREHAESLDS